MRPLALSFFLAGLSVACGGSVSGETAILFDDAGNPILDTSAPDALPDTHHHDGFVHDTAFDTSVDDTEPETWVDPGCPDAPAPKPSYACDPLKTPPGDCKAGEACYPYVEYPTSPCDHEHYYSACFPAGTGKQGDPCSSAECAAGFACVVSGAGNVCVKMCKPGDFGACPDGLVCEPTDVPGIGGCL